jgi:hypothetical protein
MTVGTSPDAARRAIPDPLAIHPAAAMFPSGDGGDYDAYTQALARHLREHRFPDAEGCPACAPVVVTSDGALLEGRGRWRAYQHNGTLPITRTERVTNPWVYVLTANLKALRALPLPARAMVLGHVPMVGRMGLRDRSLDEPPPRRVLMELSGVASTAIQRAQAIHQEGVSELIELVSEGAVPLGTAARMCHSDLEVQRRFVTRVRAGESPYTAGQVLRRSPGPKPSRAPTAVASRRTYVREAALRQLLDNFSSLELLLESAEDLDPQITPDEADVWLTNLKRHHIAYSRITTLLRQRRDSSS